MSTCRKGEQEVKSPMDHEKNTMFKARGKYLDRDLVVLVEQTLKMS